MSELERALSAIGGELDYPPTPALAPAVRARVVAAPSPRRGVRPRAGDRAGVRRTADRRGQRVRRVARAAPLGARLARAAQRRDRAGPEAAGNGGWRPACAWNADHASGRRSRGIVHATRAGREAAGRGVLLRGATGRPGGTRLHEARRRADADHRVPRPTAVRVHPEDARARHDGGGRVGEWPARHLDRRHAARAHVQRLATVRCRGTRRGLRRTRLLWRQGDLLLRLEAHISKAAALKIAGSMR